MVKCEHYAMVLECLDALREPDKKLHDVRTARIHSDLSVQRFFTAV